VSSSSQERKGPADTRALSAKERYAMVDVERDGDASIDVRPDRRN